jgi:uncharacterized protein YndB with AHSA1/START domain
MTSNQSSIERTIVVRAPRSRVWRAITDVNEFSKWFRVKAEGEFKPGARVQMTSTHEKAAGVAFHVDVETIEPERIFSWKWPASEAEPTTTTVVFKLEDVDGGTRVTVTETGFDKVSLAHRAKALEDNTEGWTDQMASLERYVGASS